MCLCVCVLLQVLVAVALEDGNNLQGAWVHLLKSVSRYDLVCQLAAGVMTDHDIFASSSPHARDARTMSSKLRSKATKAIHRCAAPRCPFLER